MCGQPSLGMRSRRAVRRRQQGEGRRGRGQGEGRRRGQRRRQRTTTTARSLYDDDDLMSQVVVRRRTRTPWSSNTPTTSLPHTSDPPASSSTVNISAATNESLIAGEQVSYFPTTTTTTSVTSTAGLPSTTDSRPRRTRRPRRKGNRGSRRHKNQRRTPSALSTTTESMYPDDRALWGSMHHHHGQREGLDAAGPGSPLQRMIADIRGKLTTSRELLTQLPTSLCSTLSSAGVHERRCWNGTSYIRSVSSPVS